MQSEATQRSLPVVRLNLRVLRVRDDDEGFEVRRVEQRVSLVDANPIYYVFWSFEFLRCDDACTRSVACYAKAELLLSTEREVGFSCDVIA